MKLIYYLLPFIAGAGITIQVGLNSKLGNFINSPTLASLISFIVGSLGLGTTFIINVVSKNDSLASLQNLKESDWWMWIGGLLGAFYIFTTIFTSQKIGFANMFSLVIGGQIILAIIFDHFGIMGATVHPINSLRIIGTICIIIGVYIIQTN
ncbi:DMT family transporter [Orenia marismortui]|uniref:DMT family transporter n=1 Tax=Orenia marismortui TaxID=46469 RepID=UPI000367E67F|nr:DMT family transporter [Orenia marismortui]